MITRIFRVKIVPVLRAEFEAKFASVSIHALEAQQGFRRVAIHRPAKWAPDEYAMISEWENEASLIRFAGENWQQAVIPEGMERYVERCWVHHYGEW